MALAAVIRMLLNDRPTPSVDMPGVLRFSDEEQDLVLGSHDLVERVFHSVQDLGSVSVSDQ